MGRKKITAPELKVVFDTNALFTDVASDLLKQEVVELIRKNNDHTDVVISWYLPETVRHERQYQMSQKALTFLGPIERLEKLLGHNLSITKEFLENRVGTVINEQIATYGLKTLEIDSTKLDLKKMMLDSAYRRPPFETGEKKEKGFRDALVAEAFMQLVESAALPKGSLIVLVTGDQLLAEAVKNRTLTRTHVRILNSLEDLKGLINTIVSTVDENFVNVIQPKAQKFFFELENRSTFIYKQNVTGQINDKFKDELHVLPEGAELRENGNYVVYGPRFIRKEGKRIFWATKITVEAKAYKYKAVEVQPSGSTGKNIFMSVPGATTITAPTSTWSGTYLPNVLTSTWDQPAQSYSTVSSSGLYGLGTLSGFERLGKQKVLMKTGFSNFDVSWSVNRNQDGKLSAARIDELKHTETTWSET